MSSSFLKFVKLFQGEEKTSISSFMTWALHNKQEAFVSRIYSLSIPVRPSSDGQKSEGRLWNLLQKNLLLFFASNFWTLLRMPYPPFHSSPFLQFWLDELQQKTREQKNPEIFFAKRNVQKGSKDQFRLHVTK